MEEDLREIARQKLGYFTNYHRYPIERLEKDYEYEIINFSNEVWDAPKRAARLSAAVKNYKTSQMLIFIFDIALNNELDLTPLVVKRLCHNLFGRTGSQSLIVDIFGVKQRTHRSEHSSPEKIQELTNRYRLSAHNYWDTTLADIDKVKRGFRKEIRSKARSNEG